MKPIIYTSCYTNDYLEDANLLIDSLNKFNLPHDVQNVRTIGKWRDNLRTKAAFMKQQLEKYYDTHSIVWIDSDSIVKQYPKLFYEFEDDIDIAAWEGHGWMSTATYYIRPNKTTLKFVDLWIQYNNTKKHVLWPEQTNFNYAFHTLKPKRYILPVSYTSTNYGYFKQFKIPQSEVVIEHMMASQRQSFNTFQKL